MGIILLLSNLQVGVQYVITLTLYTFINLRYLGKTQPPFLHNLPWILVHHNQCKLVLVTAPKTLSPGSMKMESLDIPQQQTQMREL
jgi:hypothetical protein